MCCYLSDLSGASLSQADPSITAGTYSPVLLGGNPVILSVPAYPSVDDTLIKLTVIAKYTDDGVYSGGSGTTLGATLAVGSSLPGSQVLSMSGVGIGAGTYAFEEHFLWDSTVHTISAYLIGATSAKSGTGNSNGLISGAGGFRATGISTQSAIQFMFGAYWNNTTNPTSVTLTRFTLSLV